MFQTQSKVAVPVQLNLLMSLTPSGSTHKPHNYRSNVALEFRLFDSVLGEKELIVVIPAKTFLQLDSVKTKTKKYTLLH